VVFPDTSFFEVFIILVILGVCLLPLLAAGIAVVAVVITRQNREKEK
jgi:hypothetical protein